MYFDREHFNLRDHCHVNSNDSGDRFVGIKADSDDAMVYFPIGYELPNKDDELRRDIKNLIQILATFTDKTDEALERENVAAVPRSVAFPIQAYLNVINYYLDHNGAYYTETEATYKVNARGKTVGNKTIKTQKQMIQGKSLIYLNQVIRFSSPDNTRLITRIHKFCVYESFGRIGWLYTTYEPERPDIDFDKDMFIAVLKDKLGSTNNDNEKMLFRSMLAMIEFIDNKTNDKQVYFGTDRFETVWEKLIDRCFGEQNKENYFPHARWTERYGPNKEKPARALEPDSIMIYKGKFYVLDAKYYRYGCFPHLGIGALPQSSDINKQTTYGEFVNSKSKGALVFNAFLMPYNKENNGFSKSGVYANVAEATGDWIVSPKSYERIQGIMVDTRYLLKNYDGNHDTDRKELCAVIEESFASGK